MPNAYRIVNGKDLVPQVVPHFYPPSWGLIYYYWNKKVFYTHIGMEIWYNSKNSRNYIWCNEAEDSKCSTSINNLDLKIDDHGTYLGIFTGC